MMLGNTFLRRAPAIQVASYSMLKIKTSRESGMFWEEETAIV